MKFKVEINETKDALMKYLSKSIGKRYSLFENRKIIGKQKKNKIILLYNHKWNRFPTGIVFYGKIIDNSKSTIITGYFILSPFSNLFYCWCFVLTGFVYFHRSHFTFFPLGIGIIMYCIDFYFSYKQKKYIINFLNEIKNYYNKTSSKHV